MTPDLNRLSEPFGPSDLEWRVQRAGEKNGKTWAMLVAYITNRAIMDRLDEVCGPGNWRNDFREGPGGGVLCGISIRVDDEWVTKWDGAENTDIEAVKGGLSGAMKRAGVQWGMGRYLYRLEEAWANVHDRGALRGQWIDKNKNRHYFNYDPPDLPRWALPPDGSDTETGRAGERVDTTTGEVREDEPGGQRPTAARHGKASRVRGKALPVARHHGRGTRPDRPQDDRSEQGRCERDHRVAASDHRGTEGRSRLGRRA